MEPRILSADEQTTVASAAAETDGEVAAYLAAHPELAALIAAFTAAALEAKPADLVAFARDYFAAQQPHAS